MLSKISFSNYSNPYSQRNKMAFGLSSQRIAEPLQVSSESETLHDARWLALKKVKYMSQEKDGTTIEKDWLYTKRPNAKQGAAVNISHAHGKNGEDEIIFLETMRPPLIAEGITKNSIELTAGLIGDEKPNQTVEEAHAAENKEESGLEATKITTLARNCPSSAGLTNEVQNFARVDIDPKSEYTPPQKDGGVTQVVHRVPVGDVDNQVKKWIAEGHPVSCITLAGLYLDRIYGDSQKENTKTSLE